MCIESSVAVLKELNFLAMLYDNHVVLKCCVPHVWG
jgi:hypothetical protein